MRTHSSNRIENDLVCQDCGNRSRFIEVMAEEVHLVDAKRNYIRLLEGVVDHYLCPECGASIKADEPIEK
jgi:predicted RNA-binding Zn-ribbon protein involved in translation (DUF1610 family)